ncbi:hypothetical protein PENTCL1PPCAC_3850, partial [Pristionchus entomophagus]
MVASRSSRRTVNTRAHRRLGRVTDLFSRERGRRGRAGTRLFLCYGSHGYGIRRSVIHRRLRQQVIARRPLAGAGVDLDGVCLHEGTAVHVLLRLGELRSQVSRHHVRVLPGVRLSPARPGAREAVIEAVVEQTIVRPVVHVQLFEVFRDPQEFRRHLDQHVLFGHVLLHPSDLIEVVYLLPGQRRVEVHQHEEEAPKVVLSAQLLSVVHRGRREAPGAAEVGAGARRTRPEHERTPRVLQRVLPRQAEIDDVDDPGLFRLARVTEDEVCGLDVAVYEARVVNGLDRVETLDRHLGPRVERVALREVSYLDPSQVFAEQRHDHVADPLPSAGSEQHRNVALEAALVNTLERRFLEFDRAAALHVRALDLEGRVDAGHRQVLHSVDLAEAALVQQLLDLPLAAQYHAGSVSREVLDLLLIPEHGRGEGENRPRGARALRMR